MYCLLSIFSRLERKKYHHHRGKSPEKYATLIINGMDQATTNMIAKSQSSLWKLRTYVSGILIRTKSPHGKLACAYIDLLQCSHGSNLTITFILKVLVHFAEITRKLPGNLYIQMDNTARENKNIHMLSFRAMLVKLNIFKKVSTYSTEIILGALHVS